MEPTGLRDVFKCITLSIAAIEDAGLHPRAGTTDPPQTLRPASGLHDHVPPDHPHVTGATRRSDACHRDGGSSQKRSSCCFLDPQVILPQLPLQHAGPLGVTDTMLLNPAVRNGNTNAAGWKRTGGDPSKWKQNEQKQLRMEGKAYVSKRKKNGEVVTKHPRAVGPRCTSTACKKASNRFCDEIDEEARRKVFEEFWQHASWAQRKLYVAEQVDREPVERSRAAAVQSRRSVSLRYHLMVEGKRKQVCKNMFLSTLGVGEWSVLSWVQKGSTAKNGSNKNRLEKRPGVPQGPHLNSAASAVSITADVSPEHVNATELEASARKKSRVAKPLSWKQNRQKQLRMEGKAYISKRKKDGTTITKGQRTMGSGCTSGACKRASNRFCPDFSEETRNELFSGFWQCMNWTQRRIYVSGLVDCDPVERTRAPWTQSRRSVSMRYHLIADGDRKQVCKKMFLSTLGVGEWSVLNWAQGASQQDDAGEIAKKQTQRRSRKASEHVVLNEFLEGLPKVPSFGCGTSISKVYLEPVFSNMSEVYRHYHDHCREGKTAPLSRQVFCAVFKKMDLGLCDPKRDHQGCSFGANGNLFNELWEEYCLERGVQGQPERAGNQ